MKTRWLSLFLIILGTLAEHSAQAAPTLTQQLDTEQTHVGQPVTLTLKLINAGNVDFNLNLPPVDGLEYVSQQIGSQSTFINGQFSSEDIAVITIVADRAGTFTIPAFDLKGSDGEVVPVKEMKLEVLPALTTSSAPPQNSGPVVMPPTNPATPPNNASPAPDNGHDVPRDRDGRLAKFFITLSPETTDAYVGQAIQMRIDCYIRVDVMAQQDSLPTLNGSDFLITPLNTRPMETQVQLGDETYVVTSWNTALMAAKPGDYPVQMARETNWTDPQNSLPLDPFFNPFMRQATQRTSAQSNHFIIHIHPLPEEGKPADFTGAIGNFKVEADAAPKEVTLGEPVMVRFSISGHGNFDHVFCPKLAVDPNWKTYTPEAKTTYRDEAHTDAEKVFSQPLIAQKNGTLSLPGAGFSYFNPATKQYVSVPINLPDITVTGTAQAALPVTTSSGTTLTPDVAAVPSDPSQMTPNRPELGHPVALTGPILLKQAWFWPAQGILVALCLLGTIVQLVRLPSERKKARLELLARQKSLHEKEDAMGQAVRADDTRAFFLAARSAVQLRLGSQWGLPPASITLAEIRERDEPLAETLAPLFNQADEVIYSGLVPEGIDLPAWEKRLRELLSQTTLTS